MISNLMKILDTGTKRHPKQDSMMQTSLSLLPDPSSIINYTLDQSLNELKLNNLARMMSDYSNSTSLKNYGMEVTQEDTIKQFSYMMTEKVKKDLIEKKGAKSTMGSTANKHITSFTDFMCAVTLTNTNSINGSRA